MIYYNVLCKQHFIVKLSMFLFELHLYNSITNMVEHRMYIYYSFCVLMLYVTLQNAFYLTWYMYHISALNVSLEWHAIESI